MKNVLLKNTVKCIIRECVKILHTLKILTPKIIVYMEGGICSQMKQYVVGQIFAEKGYRIEYDIEWFQTNGYDNDRQFVRTFDLIEAFNIKIHYSNKLTNWLYKKAFMFHGNHLTPTDFTFMIKKPPVYLGGFYELPDKFWLENFANYFCFVTNSVNIESNKILDKICFNDKITCAVHVRRGDLKFYNPYYGSPPNEAYFIEAVRYLASIINEVEFFFFSDEPQWVNDNLLIHLNDYTCYNSCINDSDKGFFDLLCISKCNHQIASIGSFGKFGSLLNAYSEKILILRNDPIEYVWKSRHPRVIIIGE